MRKLLFMLLSFHILYLSAQEIDVKSFGVLENAQTNEGNPRNDANGNPCALLKVHSLMSGLEFEGWVIGDVERKDNVYRVYIAGGAKHVKIKHPDCQTKDLVFSEFNISSLSQGAIYELFLEDEHDDTIDKVYQLGWNIGDISLSRHERQVLHIAASRGDMKALIVMAQITNRLHWIEELLERGDSTCLDSMPGELMYRYARKKAEMELNRPNIDAYVAKDIYTDISLLDLKACLKGYEEAIDALFEDYPRSKGLPQLKKEVERICMKYADKGSVKAMTCLGRIAEKGICETIDLKTAEKWYRKIHQLSPSNQSRTDLCRVYGNNQYPIDPASLSFIKQGASEGLTEALYQLGCMYEEGRNVPQNVNMAIELFNKGLPGLQTDPIAEPYQNTYYRLAKIYYDQKNYRQAKRLLVGMPSDHLDARYLQAMCIYYDARPNNFQPKADAFVILSDLSKNGYEKATSFIKIHY